jgi:hypothetical protein
MRVPFASLPARSSALALVAAVLAGCGSSSHSSNGVAAKPPGEIVAVARSAGAGAATVHVAGSILSAGKPISLNMELVSHKGGEGRLTFGDLDLELVDVDRVAYAKGNAAFYEHFAGAPAARLLQGKWLKGSAVHGALAPLASIAELGTVIDAALAGHGALSRVPTTTVDGREVVGVRDRTGGGTLYVASTGTPYPVAIVKAGARAGEIVFDRWNKPVSLDAPADAVSVEQLQGGR